MKAFTAVTRIVTTGLLMAIAGSATAQQAYPNRPIRLITPYPPGGSTSVMARLIGQKLAESWGQQVIVDNRGGGNTTIGTEIMVKSPPDGYTMLLITTAHVTIPLLVPTTYDAIKDVAPIATLGSTEFVLVVHPSVAANNLKEFIALAKSKPGQLNYATSASGSLGHMGIELFSIVAGVRMQHIPYKGAGPVLVDLLGGQVQLFLAVPTNVVSHVNSGRLKGIAVTGETRLSAVPQVPTFSEGGLSGLDVKNWYGILAPAGTPRAIIDKLSPEIARIVAQPDTKDKLVGQGVEPFYSTPDQFAALMKTDLTKYAKIIKAANIKMTN